MATYRLHPLRAARPISPIGASLEPNPSDAGRQMAQAYARYAAEMPEGAFPTFLESLYFETLGGERTSSGQALAGNGAPLRRHFAPS